MPRGYVCKRRFGVALFDNVASPKSGWACLSNASPFYFLSGQELPGDAVWLSNLPRTILHDQDFISLRYIKPADYLFTPITQLILELGIRQESDRHKSRYLANIFFNVVNHMYLQTGTYGSKYDALNTDLRRVCVPEESLFLKAAEEASSKIVAHLPALANSLDDNCQCTTLIFHRYEYARHLLTNKFPLGRWSKVPKSIMESGQQLIAEWINDSSRPLIIKVEVSYSDSLAERLFSICCPMDDNMHWVTHSEYSWLSRYADLVVLEAFVCEGYGPSPLSVPELGRVAENSFAFGLYCENVWTSLTKSLSGHLSKSPLAAWLTGHDRVMCLDKAYNVEKNTPFVVNGLGYGRIRLANRNESRAQMPNVAFQQGLIAPMCKAKDTFHRTLPDSATPSQFMEVVMERGALGFIQQTDFRALADAIDLYDQHVYERAPYRTIAL